MSARRFAKLARALREAAVDAAWIQWPALGGQAAAPRAPVSIVDPEALVLFSLWMRDDEPRIWDFLYGFAELGSRLLSVQRLKRLLKAFPDDAGPGIEAFAAAVSHFGKDPRWSRLAGRAEVRRGRPGKTASPAIRLAEPGALMLRLRAAFGPDVRTDALAYLIGQREVWADVREIAGALGYAKYSVRGACEALADARLIESSGERPVRYFAGARRWAEFLGMPDVAPWRPWAEAYGLALRLLAWLHHEGAREMSDSLASSLAREFVHVNGSVLRQLQLDVPDHRDRLGEAYLPAFEQTVEGFGVWLREKA